MQDSNGKLSGAREASGSDGRGPRNNDKLRGGYYTPPAIARWLCRWAIRSKQDRVLEPSAGDGAFLLAAAAELLELGASPAAVSRQLTGIEIDPAEAKKASRSLTKLLGDGAAGAVHPDDFFRWLACASWQPFDCVVGNPPFIRYQNFPEPCRSRAMELLARLNLRPNKLTNIWVPFVAGATASLAVGGRLALVLPAELLQVSYAAQLRSFLVDHFERIDLLACNQLFFPGAEQEVVLLLADGRVEHPSPGNQCSIDLLELARVEEILLASLRPKAASRPQKRVRHDSEKWLKYLLTAREISFMRRLRAAREMACLDCHASVDVGVVTGENGFFVLARDEVQRLGLEDYVSPLIARSIQLKGAQLTGSDWETLAQEGHRVFLLHLKPERNGALADAVRAYVRLGEERNIHKGYKCSIRDPWYCVPAVWTPDCFFFRQIYDFPRVVWNRAGATSTDTIHRMRCQAEPPVLTANLYTYLTAASAEIEGRSYGGGVLELEPTEAERLLVPRVLGQAMPIEEMDRLIRVGRLSEVLEENSKQLLSDGLGLTRKECHMLQSIWSRMRDRRLSRRRGVRATR